MSEDNNNVNNVILVSMLNIIFTILLNVKNVQLYQNKLMIKT